MQGCFALLLYSITKTNTTNLSQSKQFSHNQSVCTEILKKNGINHIFRQSLLNKSENATLQLSRFCEKVLDKKYLLKLNNIYQTSSKRLVQNPPICLVRCLSYAPLSV